MHRIHRVFKTDLLKGRSFVTLYPNQYEPTFLNQFRMSFDELLGIVKHDLSSSEEVERGIYRPSIREPSPENITTIYTFQVPVSVVGTLQVPYSGASLHFFNKEVAVKWLCIALNRAVD